MIPHEIHLQIGSLLFEGVDQIDLTGPFEVLSRILNSTYRIYRKTAAPVRDLKGLWLTPDASLADAPPLDVLHVPGGFGQEALMEDTEVLDWIRRQATGACRIFSACTGALLCGAAGLLKGRRATTHWASFHLLPLFGAHPGRRTGRRGRRLDLRRRRHSRNRRPLAPRGRVARRGRRSGHSASHGLCAGAALRQRHARDRVLAVAGAGRPLSLSRRRPDRFRRRVLKARGLRIRRMGGDGTGVLPQTSEDGAREGAEFIVSHIVRATDRAFDDFAAGAPDTARLRKMLGLPAETPAAPQSRSRQ